MRTLVGAALLTAVMSTGSFTTAFAGDEHDHDHDHDHDHEGESGLVIEGEECVGLLGREGTPGPFAEGSEELTLAGAVAECNLCLELGQTEEICLEGTTRGEILESNLNGGLEGGMSLQPGRREGAKVKFELTDGSKETYVCHFHSYESGEIDCH